MNELACSVQGNGVEWLFAAEASKSAVVGLGFLEVAMKVKHIVGRSAILGAIGLLMTGVLACTSTRDEEPGSAATSYEKAKPLDTFGDLEEDSEAYPWLSKENEQSGPLGDAMSQSPYAQNVQSGKSKSTVRHLKKASKRSAKRKAY